MDLARAMETISVNGKKYFLIIVDDYSHGNWVELLTFKSKTVPNVQDFIHRFETGYNVKVCSIMPYTHPFHILMNKMVSLNK